MTPLMISPDVQNYAFLVELPVETVFSENEDIQTIQIDECSSLTSTSINSAIQPMIIASTDSQGNCFVTLQDEQAYNSCSPWTSQNEIRESRKTSARTGTATSSIITTPHLTTHQTAAPTHKTLTLAAAPTKTAMAVKTTRTIRPSPVGTAMLTSAIPVSTSTTTTRAVAMPAPTTTTSATTTTTSSQSAIRKIPLRYCAKTNVQNVTGTDMPNAAKVVNSRSTHGLRSFNRCGRSRMIADHLTSIPVSEFKLQLNDTSDIIGKLDLAPPTKRRMNLLQWKGIGKLFASPGQRLVSEKMMKLFTRHLRTTLLPPEETYSDMELLPVGYKQEVDPSKIKRITRRRRYPEAEEYQRRMFQEKMQQTLQGLIANGQIHIQTVYLDNTDTFKDQSSETMQVLIESSDNGSYGQSDHNKVVGMYENENLDDGSIIVIHNSQDTDQGSAFPHQNVEVLLAAAGESGMNSDGFHPVFICNTENDSESVLPCASSIIIVPNDPLAETITETVVTS